MKIDINTVDKIAKLARLEIAPEDKENVIKDLSKILSFMEKLNELDTTGVEPLVYMSDGTNITRNDVVKEVITHEEALQNAPDHDADYFKIPKVIAK